MKRVLMACVLLLFIFPSTALSFHREEDLSKSKELELVEEKRNAVRIFDNAGRQLPFKFFVVTRTYRQKEGNAVMVRFAILFQMAERDLFECWFQPAKKRQCLAPNSLRETFIWVKEGEVPKIFDMNFDGVGLNFTLIFMSHHGPTAISMSLQPSH